MRRRRSKVSKGTGFAMKSLAQWCTHQRPKGSYLF